MTTFISGGRLTKVTALLWAFVLLTFGSCSLFESSREDSSQIAELEAGFINPPPESRPRVWWHWMNGNISSEGIVKDLEWMHRVGIGGVQNFDAAMSTPVIVEDRLAYMTPPWQEAFRVAVDKASELDLEFAIASSAGWSLTGGPWVPPADAMKKLVWSETRINGGGQVRQRLAQPPATVGPFQNLPASYSHGHNAEAIPESFYRDELVLAYPVTHASQALVPHSISVNGQNDLSAAHLLVDDNWLTGVPLPAGKAKTPGSIEYEFEKPVQIQSASMFVKNLPGDIMRGPYQPTLQAEVEGEWHTLVSIELGTVPSTTSFNAVEASKFRLLFTRKKPESIFQFSPAPGIDPSSLFGMSALPATANAPLLTDFRLFAAPKVDAYEVKAGFRLAENYHELNRDELTEEQGIVPQTVLDISGYMSADGILQWDAPPGEWKVLRLGYSLTGKTNSPATDEATGLEVDKYDAQAVERYLDNYLGMYRNFLGKEKIGKQGISALLTDSTEAGPSNWTPALLSHFQRLRGYNALPWLPVLTGELVGSRAESDAFLYDFRRTLGQLVVEQHYATVARVARENGMVVYGESLEGNRIVSTLGDDLEMRRHADIPMAAMWTFAEGGEPSSHYIADMRGAASVAHVHGQNLAAAESLTSIVQPWTHAPSDLQPMIDAEFLHGINRVVIHTSPHQPVDNKVPGLSLHVFGQYFTRHETWAEMAKPWVDYISRSSYLLQQGRFVADVAYFYGEEPPIGVLAGSEGYPGDVPSHYAYDLISPDALLNDLTVVGSKLGSSGGARYETLFLGESSRGFMTLPVLQRIYELVKSGATLVGMPPGVSPSLADDKSRFQQLVGTLWGDEPVTNVGAGRVLRSANVDEALASLNINPDVVPDPGNATSEEGRPLPFVHRELEGVDIYYVANRGEARQLDVLFRSEGRVPEIWRADTGSRSPAGYEQLDGQTRVTLDMQAWESLFVVFDKPMRSPKVDIPVKAYKPVAEIDGPWNIQFQPGRGAPASAALDELISLAEHPDDGIRYFSGISTYNNTLDVAEVQNESAYWLDLGSVGDLAEVYVNKSYAGTAWKPPYRVDIGKYLVSGENTLEIRVANRWINRLIGDRQPDSKKITYTTFNTYMPNAPLQPSGLLGPVRLLEAR